VWLQVGSLQRLHGFILIVTVATAADVRVTLAVASVHDAFMLVGRNGVLVWPNLCTRAPGDNCGGRVMSHNTVSSHQRCRWTVATVDRRRHHLTIRLSEDVAKV